MKKILLVLLLAAVMVVVCHAAQPPKMEYIKVGTGGNLTFKLKKAEIGSVLQIFAKYIGCNIVAGDDVSGEVTFSFNNVKPREGLEAILRAKGYDWFQEGETLVVTAKNTVRTYSLEYANAAEVRDALSFLAESGDSISVNTSYNALIVKASTKNISRIEKAIRDLDTPPMQVMVEARMIEVNYGDGGSIGLDVKYTNPKNANDVAQTKGFAGRPTDTGAMGMYTQVLSGNYEGYLSALLAKTNYNLVAAPRIATINHKPASILIGSKIGYRTAVITTTGTVYQVNFLTTGTNLEITPHVGSEGFIRMKIYPKVSEGTVVQDLPTENVTETNSEVLVKDGQTVVIGGLTKSAETQTDYGIPFLMDIPIIGGIFRKSTIINEKRELLVFITPHILTPEYLTKISNESKLIIDREKREGAGFIH
ncbi:MAG: type IV pilus assembly protein PilQ [Candidatus Saganbacteria bacterium]|uniref:Type IV pilus assembly protein PilQ n=1 Tax=Candidatus Saganbacteria bacterium TaxID=2575572 RepID=A0A833L127_UNCSA|nr:MAG: type IV pilus assembly protein PilQ [Candidatus Saganbacteria bacterium]